MADVCCSVRTTVSARGSRRATMSQQQQSAERWSCGIKWQALQTSTVGHSNRDGGDELKGARTLYTLQAASAAGRTLHSSAGQALADSDVTLT